MKNVIGNSAAPAAATQPTLGTLRAEILAFIVGNPLFRDAEQLRANHNVHACENVATLNKWLKNVRIEAESRTICREVAMEMAPERFKSGVGATVMQRLEIDALIGSHRMTASERAETLSILPKLTQAEASCLIKQLRKRISIARPRRRPWKWVSNGALNPNPIASHYVQAACVYLSNNCLTNSLQIAIPGEIVSISYMQN